jgi:hypothetical protein
LAIASQTSIKYSSQLGLLYSPIFALRYQSTGIFVVLQEDIFHVKVDVFNVFSHEKAKIRPEFR